MTKEGRMKEIDKKTNPFKYLRSNVISIVQSYNNSKKAMEMLECKIRISSPKRHWDIIQPNKCLINLDLEDRIIISTRELH
jgi:hypothetical protein